MKILKTKCVFDPGTGPVDRDVVINLDDVRFYFDWRPEHTCLMFKTPGAATFPNVLYISMPFSEFHTLFTEANGGSVDDGNDDGFPPLP